MLSRDQSTAMKQCWRRGVVGCVLGVLATLTTGVVHAEPVNLGTTLAETPTLAGTVLAERSTPFTVIDSETSNTVYSGTFLSRIGCAVEGRYHRAHHRGRG